MTPSYSTCYPSADESEGLDMWPRKVYKFVASHSKKGGTAALIPAYRAILDEIFSSRGPFVIEDIPRNDTQTVRTSPDTVCIRLTHQHLLIICVAFWE